MNEITPRPADRMVEVLAWIERHLDQPLTVDDIARRAALSPYHFSRLFSLAMGRSVMAHVRGRRLATAARRLQDDPDLPLVELAFDSGFDSQEAFTRAFKRVFGVAPGRFRRGVVSPIEGHYPMTPPDSSAAAAVVQLPDLVRFDAFIVAGPVRRFDDTTKAQIPELWAKLIGALPFPGQVPSWATYGVCWNSDRAEGRFDYMAGVQVDPGARLPDGFSAERVSAATYVVFRMTLNGGPIHPQVKGAMARIWGELIPASGLTLAGGHDFERFDGEFAPTKPGSIIDFHVPVAM